MPAGRNADQSPFGRRTSPSRVVPPAVEAARHPAARRADQPSRRRDRRLAGTAFTEISWHRDRGHARPVLPGQRRRMDSGTRPWAGHSVARQLFIVARTEAGTYASRREVGERATENSRTRVGMDTDGAESAPRQ